MINNKGYVFLPLTLFFLIIATLTIIYFQQDLSSSVNQGSFVQGLMDNIHYNYTKTVDLLINDFKLLVYTNISNHSLLSAYNDSLGGVLISNNPSIPCLVGSESYSKDFVNLTFPEITIMVSINYPIADLVNAYNSFNPLIVQQCLDTSDCLNNRDSYSTILINCLNLVKPGGFNLRNSSVPVLIGGTVYIGLELLQDNMTYLFPFNIGEFSFSC